MRYSQLPLALGISVAAAVAPLTTHAGSKGGSTQPYVSLQVNAQTKDLVWLINGEWYSANLRVSNTEIEVQNLNFKAGETIKFSTTDSLGIPLSDGLYKWELSVLKTAPGTREGSSTPAESMTTSGVVSIVNGKFLIPTDNGVDSDDPNAEKAQVIVQDLIVQGSIATGFDAVNGENFGSDTLRLKENNLRIHFNDTSNSGSFPSNDWRIVINDTTNGGNNYFAVEDSTAGRFPFLIEAGAKANSLYVDSTSRIGIGTSTPSVQLHQKIGDSPTLRLEQDGSSGFTPQTWDMVGNEANFFIRDVTNGSQLPFRIKPGADTNSLFIAANNNIGMGTDNPSTSLHVRGTSQNTKVLVEEANTSAEDRTLLQLKNNGGTSLQLSNSNSTVNTDWSLKAANSGDFMVLDATTHPLMSLTPLTADTGSLLTLYGSPSTMTSDWSLRANSTGTLDFATTGSTKMTLSSSALDVNTNLNVNNNSLKLINGSNTWSNYTDGSGNVVWRKSTLPFDLMKLEGNGTLTTAGPMKASSFVTTSDVNKKQNIVPVDPVDILNKVVATPISEWSFNFGDTKTRHIGPMAQDFKASFNVGNTDKAINLTDSSGVALAAIQGLNRVIEEKDAEIDALKEKSDRMEQQLELLMKEVQNLKEKN